MHTDKQGLNYPLLAELSTKYKLPLDTMPNLSRDLVLPQSCAAKASEDLPALASSAAAMPTGGLMRRTPHTDKKGKKIVLIYRKIQSGAVAKSYMRKGFLIY